MKISFGKHIGKDMKDVSADYLWWLYGQKWLPESYPEVFVYIKNNLEGIKKELEDSGKMEYEDM